MAQTKTALFTMCLPKWKVSTTSVGWPAKKNISSTNSAQSICTGSSCSPVFAAAWTISRHVATWYCIAANQIMKSIFQYKMLPGLWIPFPRHMPPSCPCPAGSWTYPFLAQKMQYQIKMWELVWQARVPPGPLVTADTTGLLFGFPLGSPA